MPTNLEHLIDHYDSGRLSRRELLGALAMLALPGTQASAALKIGVAKQINHATLFVRDVGQSRAFYQRLFGMPVLTAQPPGVNLAVGGSFLAAKPGNCTSTTPMEFACSYRMCDTAAE